MARYKPQKATVVARDDTRKDKKCSDALKEWMSAMGIDDSDTSKFDEVVSLAEDGSADFYHMQYYLNLASVLPSIGLDVDPLDRVEYVMKDLAVKECAQRFIKHSYPTLTHMQAENKAQEMIPIIDDITGGLGDADPAALVVCIMSRKESLKDIKEELPFTPDIYELSSRIKTTGLSSSLYPVVAKENQFTAVDYNKSKNKYTTPKKTDFYDVGEKVSSTVGKEYMDVDEEASDLLMQGYNLKEVVKFHNQAPQGYWETVSKIMDSEPDTNFDEIYARLEPQFDFHPDDRQQLI